MAFYTGPLYHLKGRSENVENHNKLLDNPRGLRRDPPSMIPSLRSGCVQRCSEKSISFQALFWALELNEKIFSPHKQALSERMRWAAVLLINQYLTTHIANICEYKFPRKRVPAAAACARHHDARATGNGGYGSIATNGRNIPRNEIESVKSTM